MDLRGQNTAANTFFSIRGYNGNDCFSAELPLSTTYCSVSLLSRLCIHIRAETGVRVLRRNYLRSLDKCSFKVFIIYLLFFFLFSSFIYFQFLSFFFFFRIMVIHIGFTMIIRQSLGPLSRYSAYHETKF